MASAGGDEDMSWAVAAGLEEDGSAMDDHDLTAALFDSLGDVENTPQAQVAIVEGVHSPFQDNENENAEMEAAGIEPINWGEMDSTEPGASVHEDELENMFMALDEEGKEMDIDAGSRQATTELGNAPNDHTAAAGQEPVKQELKHTGSESPSPSEVASETLVATSTEQDCIVPHTTEAQSVSQPTTVEDTGESAARDEASSTVKAEDDDDNEKDVTAALLDSLAGGASAPLVNSKSSPLEKREPNGTKAPSDGEYTLPHVKLEEAASDVVSGDPTAEAGSAENRPKKEQEARVCIVCNKEPGKYKCPLCSAPFCSVACNRIHKENHPPAPEPPVKQPATAHEEKRKRDDDDPYGILLEHSDDILRLLKKYPHLEADLNRIGNATLPPNGGLLQMKSKNYHNFNKKPRMWTKEDGLRKGAAALRKARTDPSEKGDAVREYCELILHLLAKRENYEATRLVREQVTAGDAMVVERLMKEEKDKD